MISDKYKCIFVHLPKAAGQSVELFFLKHHNLSWKNRSPLLLKFNPDPDKGPEKLAHLKASEYIDCGHIGQDNFNSYFKFTFIRNPWARLVSEYNFRNYHKNMSFKEFVRIGLPDECNYSDAYRHIVPQYDFLYDANGNLLVDFIGRFESLQSDFDHVCSELGFNDSLLPHKNRAKNKSMVNKIKSLLLKQNNTKTKSYTQYYDEECKKIVSRMYSKDIETFKYRFGE